MNIKLSPTQIKKLNFSIGFLLAGLLGDLGEGELSDDMRIVRDSLIELKAALDSATQ